ncbi:MAG: hypothetical protein ACOZNI_04355, partial [Myxococcota bacterium]
DDTAPGDTAPDDTATTSPDTGGEAVDTGFDCGASEWVDTGGEEATAPLPSTEGAQMLVLAANMKEASSADDVDEHADMKEFARRVRTEVPYAPDVVLLQEVVADSAAYVAEKLEDETGHAYVVAIGPEEDTTVESGDDYQIKRDVAVLYNDTTMKVATHDGGADEGGFLSHWYNADENATTGEKRNIKQSAFIYLKKDGIEDTKFGFVSVHFATSENLASEEVALEKKGEWSAEVVTEIEGRYTYADGFVLGGDFNNRRCEEKPETIDCEPTAAWSVLVDAYDYLDAVFDLYGSSNESLWSQYRKADECVTKRIDYLFVKGRVLAGSHDVDYARVDEGADGFYSDHRFLWALVEKDAAR